MKRGIAMAATAALFAQSAAGGDGSTRTIYRCETASGITFADRPCGPTSETYQPDLAGVSVIDTVVPAGPARRIAVPAARSVRQSTSGLSRAESCARLDQAVHKIVATMRAGYTAKQGERLRERKQELEARRRAEKC